MGPRLSGQRKVDPGYCHNSKCTKLLRQHWWVHLEKAHKSTEAKATDDEGI